MNPTSYKLLKLISDSSYSLFKPGRQVPGLAYLDYGYHLTKNWFPKVSYLKTSSDAYYPKRVQWAGYLVYGLIGSFALFEYNYQNRVKRNAENKFLALRE
ncbi:hypothetical protein PPERSA_08816 [Pseudocohnilembus persalinus]|uniref:Uncharacterized protein n=1 Tax=Pseudocohnilembus persalinus TaxID=266149 RepID=A0A0V0R3N9_PSEPJ|nr:hypothetical protein PPERSA_08816 [Pseudocohnilembus persalinus]|eukprot:KRX09100.1 hypothetical protein PPERSA_08816 [Pseudocohnilembus persalinus]